MLSLILYFEGEISLYMILAAICGLLLLLAFPAFYYNIAMSLGLKGVPGIFTGATKKDKELVTTQA